MVNIKLSNAIINESVNMHGPEEITISLHEFERENIALESPITTATWFEGDVQTAAQIVKNRVHKILEVNPWLTGNLVKGPKYGITTKDIHLLYKHHKRIPEDTFNSIFKFCSVHDFGSYPQIRLGMPLGEIFIKLANHGLVVRKSSSLLNTKEPIFQVVILPDSMKTGCRFVLIMSLCHRVADGCNFYTLYNMLNPSKPLLALNPRRKMHAVQEIEKLMDCPMMDGCGGLWVTLLFIREVLRSKVKREQYKSKMFFLNQSYIKNEKELAISLEDQIPFISTNDIVTSNFFSVCKADQGFMTVNFRDRVKDCTKMDSGNYFNTVRYRPEDFAKPTLIRKSIGVKKISRASKPATEALPNTPVLLQMKTPHLSICTNWSSYYDDDFMLETSLKELLHAPLKDMRYASPTLMSNCTIFKLWPGQLAVCVTATAERIAKFAEHPMVDSSSEDRVPEEMLPYFVTTDKNSIGSTIH